MSEVRVRHKSPPKSKGANVPAWLLDRSFSGPERKAYLEAAQKLGFDVTDWARSQLNRAARAALGIGKPETRRAPRSLATLPRPTGHARRPSGRRRRQAL